MLARPFLFAVLLLCSVRGSALTVTVNVGLATCGNNTGYAIAWVYGGAPPYAFLWSNGATTDTITGLAPGNYSVTVTDANSDQVSDNFTIFNMVNPVLTYDWTTLGVQGCHGQCNGGIWYDELAMPLNLVPPFNFATPPTYGLNPNNILQGAWVGFCPGYSGVITTVTDALGCVAQLTLGNTIPDSDPSPMSVMSTSPSCSAMNRGAMVVDIGWDDGAVGGNWQSRLLDASMQPVSGVTISGFPSTYANITTIINRFPGDYFIERRFQNFYSGDCVDLLPVTIPNLGPNCGVVAGTAHIDLDQDCFIGGAEPRVPTGIIEVQPGPVYASLGTNGNYSFCLTPGNYTLTQTSADLVEHCTGAPIPFTISAGSTATRNLPDTSIVPLDLEVVVGSGAARPGFQFQCAMTVRNLTPTASGPISLVMTFDPLLAYVSSTPAGTVLGNAITWNQAQLTAWQQRNYVINFQVPANPALIGTQLLTTATLSSVGNDPVPANNTATNTRTITGSYDPNDKLAVTSTGDSSQWTIGTDEWIDYTIRFQNTGTDTAFNILITDTLPVNLDPLSLIMGAASHAFTWELRDQRTLKFHFQNILLPDSNFSEPLSHGFVGFRVRPRLPLMPGETIANIANIYFDFNPPVITEPSVLVAEFSTGVSEVTSRGIRLSPNPVSEVLTVHLPDGSPSEFVLLAVDGRQLQVPFTRRSDGVQLDVGSLAPGVYLLRTKSGTARFLKT